MDAGNHSRIDLAAEEPLYVCTQPSYVAEVSEMHQKHAFSVSIRWGPNLINFTAFLYI